MNIRNLRIFATVYKEKGITKAADKLGINQPSVSLAIREMESYYKTKLFERYGRGIKPTEAGNRLYQYASRVLHLYEEMDEEMLNWNENGLLRIGSSISIGACLMPEFVQTYKRKHKDANLYIKVDSSDVIEEMLLENKLDIALIEGTVHSKKIVSEQFQEDELVTICSRFHPLAKKGCITLEELKNENILLREPNSGTREMVDSVLALHNIHVTPIWESTSTAALIQAVAAQLGISILPKRMVQLQARGHEVVPLTLEGISLKRYYNIVYHENKYLTQSAIDFMEMVRRL